MRWLAPLVVAVLLARSAAADGDVATARALYEQGAALAEEGRWKDALAKFEQSSIQRPHATTSYNLGYCERALGRPTRARKYFAAALARDEATGGTELTPELRAASATYRDEMSALIAVAALSIEEPGAIVTIDGAPIERAGDRFLAGTLPPGPGLPAPTTSFAVEVDPGAHEIVVTAKDGRSRVVHEYLAPGVTKSVRITLPVPVVVHPVDDTGARKTWGYVFGGIGIVGLGLGTYFGLSARSKWSSAKDLCPARADCSADAVRLSSDAHTNGNISTVAFVAGGAALVGGTLLVITSRSTTVDAAIGPRGTAWLSVKGAF